MVAKEAGKSFFPCNTLNRRDRVTISHHGGAIIDLTDIQRLILHNLCRATQGSKGAHVPKTYFMSKPALQDHKAKKALRDLVALNYVLQHPTGGGMTYALDERGLEVCRKLREELKRL